MFLAALLLTSPLLACGNYGQIFDPQIRSALSENARKADAAVQRLRESGPVALSELFEYRETLLGTINENAQEDFTVELRDELTRLDDVIDRVGGQKYCTASKLYWYTDLEQAKAVAEASGKPILSLRMLGKLTDEYSCANSRFFRTTLYANDEISKMLREQYVLHWKSVRPVPKVTIDFGDGRKLERTLTGNSIHYVLDFSGRTIDALPGLYGPQAFVERLNLAREAWKQSSSVDANQRDKVLYAYHLNRLSEIESNWTSDLQRAKQFMNAQGLQSAVPPQLAQPGAAPPVEVATRRALPKAAVEMPMLRALKLAQLDADTSDELWNAIGRLHAEDAMLDEASVTLIQRQNPTAFQAGQVAITKRVVENPLLRLVRNLQSSIALDTVRNEYQLHRKIHEWFVAQDAEPMEVEALNERVYAELFLTPSSDPWLGLVPANTYTALKNNGIVLTESP
jgi:hypothetical protein